MPVYAEKLPREKPAEKPWHLRVPEATVAGLGGFVAIAILAFLHYNMKPLPILFVPLGATSVLAFGAPNVPFAQPRNIIGGHLIAATVGIIIFSWAGTSSFWVAGLANGLAIGLMVATKTVHPPAGATAILPVLTQISSPFWVLAPVAVGAVVITLIAYAYNNLWGSRRKYPVFWW